MNVNKILSIAALLTIIALLFLVFRGCDPTPVKPPPPSPAPENKELVNRIDSLEKVSRVKDKVIDSLKEKLTITKSAATNTEKKLKEQLAQKPTIEEPELMNKNCDSIAQLAEQYLVEVQEMKEDYDSLVVTFEEIISEKNGVITVYEIINGEYTKAYNQLEGMYKGLSKQYTKQVKAKKRERTLTRVLAAGVVILGGIVLTK